MFRACFVSFLLIVMAACGRGTESDPHPDLNKKRPKENFQPQTPREASDLFQAWVSAKGGRQRSLTAEILLQGKESYKAMLAAYKANAFDEATYFYWIVEFFHLEDTSVQAGEILQEFSKSGTYANQAQKIWDDTDKRKKWLNQLDTKRFGSWSIYKVASLKELDLSDVYSRDYQLEHINHWDRLRSVNLSGTLISDKSLSFVKTLPQLEKLIVANCEGITGEGFDILKGFKLKVLSVQDCENFVDQGLIHIGKYQKGLEALNLQSCFQITDRGMLALKGMKNMTCFNINWCDNLTDKSMSVIRTMENMHDLSMIKCRWVTDEGLKELSHFMHIEYLNIKQCWGVTSQGVLSLSQLTTLRRLNLESLKISADVVNKITKALPKCEVILPQMVSEVKPTPKK